jgi:hypothetical protein
MGTFTDNPAKTKIPLRRSTMWLLAAAAYLALGATVLLWLCTFSVPHIMSLYYLKVKDHGQTVKFGTFGHCGSSRSCSDNISGVSFVHLKNWRIDSTPSARKRS